MDSRVSRGCILSIVVTLILVLFALTPTYAHAETTNTSLKLICKTDNVVLSNMDWSIYKVSSSKFEGYYMLDGNFASYPVSLEDIYETSKMLDTANTLENYAIIDSIRPVSSGTTNQNGEVSFADLEVGLYLVSGKSVVIDNTKYTPSAMLIEVTEDHETAYQLTSYPKFKVKTLLNQEVQYIVKKIWLNEKNPDYRPNDVILQLYRDGEFFEQVVINDSNDWEYSWSSLDTYEWRIKEVQIPDNYIVVYSNDETDYLVVNNYNENVFNRMVQFSISQNSMTVSETESTNLTEITNTTEPSDGTMPSSINSDGTNVTTVDTITGTDGSTVTTLTDISSSNQSNYGSNSTATDTTNVIGNNGSSSSVSNSNGSNGGTTNEIDKLPQTGQVWFPVPILVLCGIVCISIGVQMDSKKQ